MHELSIANSLVEIATEAAIDAGADRVTRVVLKLGELSCVHRSALEYSYELVTQDTILEGSELVIEEVPVVIYCPTCEAEKELPNIQSFRCPDCQTPSADIRQGNELDIDQIEVEDGVDESTTQSNPMARMTQAAVLEANAT